MPNPIIADSNANKKYNVKRISFPDSNNINASFDCIPIGDSEIANLCRGSNCHEITIQVSEERKVRNEDTNNITHRVGIWSPEKTPAYRFIESAINTPLRKE